MRDLDLSGITNFSDGKPRAENQRGIPRRQILKGIGIAGLTLVLAPRNLLAQSDGEAQEWYDLVNNIIFTVADCRQAQTMASQLSGATMYRVSRDRASLHRSFSSSFIFDGATIDAQRVNCDHSFEVVRLPYYNVGSHCRSCNDLNASEIRTVINPKEIARFDCVLSPDGYRMPLDYNDHAEYVGKAAANYRTINLDDWEVPYKRRMAGGGRAHTGYHMVHKTRRTRYGTPKTDFILSSDI